MPADPRLRALFAYERCGPAVPAGTQCGALRRTTPSDLELGFLRRRLCPSQVSHEQCRWNIAVLLVLDLAERYRYANFGLYASLCTERPEVCFELHELEQRLRVSHNKHVLRLARRLAPGLPVPEPPTLEFHRKSILRLANVVSDFVEVQGDSARWLPVVPEPSTVVTHAARR